ncbi:MAG: ligase-associated DNA damage response endonuclease PdeM [Phycisphaeraceae bacterium]|nr:MAG: ligase-associated DNA damage response endonuclease PdeM [Phycisphaeraceae bacterium]
MDGTQRAILHGSALCTIAGESLTLLPQRAIWWESASTLLLADLHLGKAAAFRTAGIPVPENTTTHDLATLSELLDRTLARRLVILGDFFHARSGRSAHIESTLDAWRSRHGNLEILLIRGNHDHSSGDPPAHLDINCLAEGASLPPFALHHHPTTDASGYVLAGHIHPAIRLDDPGTRASIRFPCFWFGTNGAVLPAFGRFTGMKVVSPRRDDAVFVIAENEVVRIGY